MTAERTAVYEVPATLSPSRISAFTSCPLAFRFASIERIPEPPSLATTRGSMVHRALELFFVRAPADRTADALDRDVDAMLDEYRDHPDLTGLDLDEGALAQLHADCRALGHHYLDMEDPAAVTPIGLELRLEAPLGQLAIRGIIDRLELDADGGLVITDYKTGRVPGPTYERASLAGVTLYALMCREVFGTTPVAVRLMYLKSKQTISAVPSEQSIRFHSNRTVAVWRAIETACVTGDFRPKRSGLCRSCAFQRWCPEFGGAPDRAAAEAPVVFAGGGR